MRSTVYASGCVEVALLRTHWRRMSRSTRGSGRTGSSRNFLCSMRSSQHARCATPDVSASTSEVEVSAGVTTASRYMLCSHQGGCRTWRRPHDRCTQSRDYGRAHPSRLRYGLKICDLRVCGKSVSGSRLRGCWKRRGCASRKANVTVESQLKHLSQTSPSNLLRLRTHRIGVK